MKKTVICLLIFSVIFSVGAGEMLALGSQAAGIEAKKWVHQQPVSLEQYKGKKPVVLFFWALDNASVMAFKPLAELTKQIKGDKVAWIGIASGDEKNISNFKLTKALPFPVAVDNGNTVKKYLPPNVKYPACVIISQDGRLAWRGTVRNMPVTLKRLLNGKLDINEIGRKEQFNISLGRAIKEKKFKDAVSLIEKEQKIKFSQELTTLHVQLLLEMKDTKTATKLLDDTIEAHPELPGPHLLRQMVYRSFFKDEQKALESGRDSVEKLKKYPLVLANLLQNEMKISLDQRSPDFIFIMADTLKNSIDKLSPNEQAGALLIYAQAMNMCSFNQLAEEAAQKAENMFKDSKDLKTAEMLKNYYHKLNKLKKEQKIGK